MILMKTITTSMLIMTPGLNVSKTEMCSSVDSVIPVKPDLEDFWNIESIGITNTPSQSGDSKAMNNFKDTLLFKDQRYQVTWPWKEDDPELPENRQLALGRLRSLVTKMKNKPRTHGKSTTL